MRIINDDICKLYGLEDTCPITAYIHDNNSEIDITRQRKAIIIFPGGGYEFISFREGEPMALEFFNRDYNVFVIKYSIAPIRYPNQFLQACCAVDYVRKNASEFGILQDNVFIMGFSAGGHLAGNVAVAYDEASKIYGKTLNCKPDGAILSYPVINIKYGHNHSYENLSGQIKKDYPEHAIDMRVNPKTPPIFLWHAADDSCVSALNSIMMAKALQENHVKYELHIYTRGGHGMSTCDIRTSKDEPNFDEGIKEWYCLADNFIKNLKS